MKKKQVEAFN